MKGLVALCSLVILVGVASADTAHAADIAYVFNDDLVMDGEYAEYVAAFFWRNTEQGHAVTLVPWSELVQWKASDFERYDILVLDVSEAYSPPVETTQSFSWGGTLLRFAFALLVMYGSLLVVMLLIPSSRLILREEFAKNPAVICLEIALLPLLIVVLSFLTIKWLIEARRAER